MRCSFAAKASTINLMENSGSRACSSEISGWAGRNIWATPNDLPLSPTASLFKLDSHLSTASTSSASTPLYGAYSRTYSSISSGVDTVRGGEIFASSAISCGNASARGSASTVAGNRNKSPMRSVLIRVWYRRNGPWRGLRPRWSRLLRL